MPVCEPVRVKTKLQWRLQEIGEVRNTDHMRKVTSSEQSHRKREEIGATTSGAVGQGYPSPLEFTSFCHNLLRLDTELQATEFALLNFSLALVQSFLSPSSSLEWEWLLCRCMSTVFNSLFDFYRDSH